MNERYLSLKEVSRIIGVTTLTLRNWDRKGLLTAYRNPVNNYRVYRYSDVADFIAEIKRTGPGDQEKIRKLEVRIEDETDVV